MRALNQIKRTFERNKIDFLIFFVTHKCNSRCRHCFFWRSLNKKEELDLKEIQKIFKNLGYIRDVSLSGGEPLLREDLTEIIKIIYENSKPRSLSLPSNGLLPNKLLRITEDTLKSCKNMKLIINLSIDGPEKIHDYVRGVKGNFKKSISAVKKLINLRQRYKNLYVNVNSVIINKNIDYLEKLMGYIRKNLDVDGHYFEIIRGDSKDKDFRIPDIGKLKNFYKKALENEKFYFEKRFKRKRVGINLGWKITKIFYIGIIKYLYSLQINTIKGKEWPFRCLAGKTSLVIYPKGEISVCELKPATSNCKDFNFDIKKLKNSLKWKKILKEIKQTKCSCTHDCFIYNTINHTPIARFLYVPLGFFRKWK